MHKSNAVVFAFGPLPLMPCGVCMLCKKKSLYLQSRLKRCFLLNKNPSEKRDGPERKELPAGGSCLAFCSGNDSDSLIFASMTRLKMSFWNKNISGSQCCIGPDKRSLKQALRLNPCSWPVYYRLLEKKPDPRLDLWPRWSFSVVSVSWLPSLIFHLSQSLPDEIRDQNWDLISYCCDVSVLLAFSSPTPCSFAKVGWNGWTFPHFPEWMSVFFSFSFFSVFVPGPTLALFPDCIVWFPCTVCGMNSEAKTRELCSPGTGRSLLLGMMLNQPRAWAQR